MHGANKNRTVKKDGAVRLRLFHGFPHPPAGFATVGEL